MTLAELMVAAAVTSMLLVTLCGVYFSVAREWEREQGEAGALVATSRACSRMADYVSRACGVVVDSRFCSNDTLWVVMPADQANGAYVPTWNGGRMAYRYGTVVGFYLSDSTGSYNRTGSILWAATWDGANVVPDQSWSLYYNTATGRIAPLTSIAFQQTNSGLPQVKVTVVASYISGGRTAQLTQTRTTCVRNAD